ncbi:hypothetical protein SCUP234_11447 [Seiridium cupressi]
MTGYPRDAGSSSSTSTGISLRTPSHLLSPASYGLPRKRTSWKDRRFNTSTKSSPGNSHSNYTRNGPDLTLEASLDRLSLDNAIPQSSYEPNRQQLREYIQKLRFASPGRNADEAYKQYYRIRNKSKAICEALLRIPSSNRPPVPSTALVASGLHATSSLGSNISESSAETRASLGSTLTGDEYRPPYTYEEHLDLIRTWSTCLENLLGILQTSLMTCYKACEPDASPAMVEQILHDKTFRRIAVSRMRNASVAATTPANLDFFSKCDMQFRDYDKLAADVSEMRRLLQNGESGISPDRTIEEIIISQRGDAILEFANTESEEFPVYRFQVSSHMLAETSPIFAQMFNVSSILPALDGESSQGLPPSPSRYTCEDGAEVRLFRMPQLELNVENSLEILLHAAHMHNDKVPREIGFDRFVAIAEAAMRYRCTAPLELSVEYLWLPQWMHKATEDMPDGLLLISYAFGLRRLFTRVSKTAILNITDREDLDSKSWPQAIKDKVWAVRAAKMGQVHHCCSDALQEYLRCPPSISPDIVKDGTPGLVPTIKPRCSKGSHACDAMCLGWLMMLFNELHVLPQIMYSTGLTRRPPLPKRSLNQLINSLRFMAGPPQSHAGPCDFASTFRAAVNDIYNSVSGLTLFDVSGKHGWALSKHKSFMPQAVLRLGGQLPDPGVVKRTTEDVALNIMRTLDSLEDIHSAALVNKAFFQAFKENELLILRGLIGKTKAPERWTINGATNRKDARAELKSLREGDANSRSQKGAGGIADIEEGLRSINIASDKGNGTLEPYFVFDEDSDVEHCHEASEGESLVEITNTERASFDQKMTREEAERILWPDDVVAEPQPVGAACNSVVSSQVGISNGPVPATGMREVTEKLRAGGLVLGILEEKTLMTREDKNLSDEHYERIGLIRPKTAEEAGGISQWI